MAVWMDLILLQQENLQTFMNDAFRMWLKNLKIGDVVTRYLAGTIPMELKVVGLTDDVVDCGWTFCRKTGAEIDDDLNWGPPPKMTGSFIVPHGTKIN